MYISNIRIRGFRNFRDASVDFNDGMNVIIGHNNSGKSNLMQALQLVIDNHYRGRWLGIYDFSRNVTLHDMQAHSPKVEISITFSNSKDTPNESPEDLRTIGTWLTSCDNNGNYMAKLTYIYSLQAEKEAEYINEVSGATKLQDIWSTLQNDFLRYYEYHIYGGSLANPTQAERDKLSKIDFQYLGALRNVEDDLFSGRSQMLRDVLAFFIDYQIKSDKSLSEDQRITQLKSVKNAFSQQSTQLISDLLKRLSCGKDIMLEYAKETGASFNNAEPDFNGDLTDHDLFAVLCLMIKYATGWDITAANNGLGYNNLIYISLLLAKMQADSDVIYLGANAKVFPLLVMEEPEAHLHPSMQYQLLKFLNKNLEQDRKARQIFITTHSTEITSAVKLDNIICLHTNTPGDCQIGYPGKVFTASEEDKQSKDYVQRFLDATKSDMLFAQKIIMVEGIAEELLMPTMAKYIGKSLEEGHVAVINVNGRYFKHFLKLFDCQRSHFAIPKKIACITDRDPERKKKADGRFQKCYPFEYNVNTTDFEYKQNAIKEEHDYATHPNIRFFSQDMTKGKTFEYDLMLTNMEHPEILITPSLSSLENFRKIIPLPYEEMEKELRESGENNRIVDSLHLCSWDEADKKAALLASRYLNSVGKGENALELAVALENNYSLPTDDPNRKSFIVPDYIQDAIKWVLS